MKIAYTILRVLIAYVFPLIIINAITYLPSVIGIYHKTFEQEAIIERTASGSELVNRYLIKGKPESQINWSKQITVASETPLLEYLGINSDYLVQWLCFQNETYYLIGDQSIEENADNIKVELNYNNEKMLLGSNKVICLDRAKEIHYYVAEFSTNSEQAIKDLKKHGEENKITASLKITFFERPKYGSLPVFLLLTIIPGWWSLLLLWKSMHQKFIEYQK